jgi:hypothetical protein
MLSNEAIKWSQQSYVTLTGFKSGINRRIRYMGSLTIQKIDSMTNVSKYLDERSH